MSPDSHDAGPSRPNGTAGRFQMAERASVWIRGERRLNRDPKPCGFGYVSGRLALLAQSRAALLVGWALAGWPVWRWFGARLDDGSDEPWGIAALGLSLISLPWRGLRARGPPRWAGTTAAVVAVAVVGFGVWPPLVRAGLWMLALVGLLGGTGPWLARTGLLLLGLPVTATAEFFLGYPLRVAVAAGNAPVLRLLGWNVERRGAALQWAGETVLIDAPCSGIQMLWTGLAAASVLALAWRLGERASMALVGRAAGVVALANGLRCTVLFIAEVKLHPVPGWLHEGIGLVLFAAALGVICVAGARLRRETGGPAA